MAAFIKIDLADSTKLVVNLEQVSFIETRLSSGHAKVVMADGSSFQGGEVAGAVSDAINQNGLWARS
jgi:hypothetical protein